MKCPRCHRTVHTSTGRDAGYCPYCLHPEPERCHRCDGAGTETSWVTDYDGTQRSEHRSCHYCGGAGSYGLSYRVHLATGAVTTLINGRSVAEMPRLGEGW